MEESITPVQEEYTDANNEEITLSDITDFEKDTPMQCKITSDSIIYFDHRY
jgi:hypothetical protein